MRSKMRSRTMGSFKVEGMELGDGTLLLSVQRSRGFRSPERMMVVDAELAIKLLPFPIPRKDSDEEIEDDDEDETPIPTRVCRNRASSRQRSKFAANSPPWIFEDAESDDDDEMPTAARRSARPFKADADEMPTVARSVSAKPPHEEIADDLPPQRKPTVDDDAPPKRWTKSHASELDVEVDDDDDEVMPPKAEMAKRLKLRKLACKLGLDITIN